MALSDREKKVLEELERGLFADDAEFAERVKAASQGTSKVKKAKPALRQSAARLVAGALVSVAGLSILVVAAILKITAFGILGFLVMLSGLVLASSNWSNTALKEKQPVNKPTKKPDNWFEDRWNRRFE
jgi:hypothetical protein